MQLRPKWIPLSLPKPGFACGLKYPARSKIYQRMREWPSIRSPFIDLFVHPQLAVPFFIFESVPNYGKTHVAEYNHQCHGTSARKIMFSESSRDSACFRLGSVWSGHPHIRLYVEALLVQSSAMTQRPRTENPFYCPIYVSDSLQRCHTKPNFLCLYL